MHAETGTAYGGVVLGLAVVDFNKYRNSQEARDYYEAHKPVDASAVAAAQPGQAGPIPTSQPKKHL